MSETVPPRRRETPDIEASSESYAARFRGPAGRYMLGIQERGLFELMADGRPLAGRTVLDVGGGHAQLAAPLAERGCRVTVAGSDDVCAARLGGEIAYRTGDLLALPFAAREFDTVVSVRLISHMADWRGLVAELCRLADRSVVIDYPTLASLNILSFATFPLKHAIEKNTRTYRSFSDGAIRRAFAAHGFRPVHAFRQFAFPMGLHRLAGATGLVRGAEEALRAIGITSLIGNPVLLRLDRLPR